VIAFQKQSPTLGNEKFNVELFDSGYEVVTISKDRQITDACFKNKRTQKLDKSWEGVSNWGEAEDLMANGYQPVVDKIKAMKITAKRVGKRVQFKNEVVGYQPVVPLYLMGVPNNMINAKVKKIKTKVLNVYYNNGCSCDYSAEQLEEAGKKLLSAILELEMQGYRFNLNAVQVYYRRKEGADVLAIKLKNSYTPVDLKRMSFQLVHPAFFRVIGFDWYSRTPRGTYRSGYGYPMDRDFNDEQVNKGFEEIFGQPCVVIQAQKIINADIPYLKELLTKGQEKRNG